MCPALITPYGPPSKETKRSRASMALTEGQGWLGLHEPSISRAAIPAIRTFGPSAHQIGPSPSQTAVGVHLNVWPSGTILPAASAGLAKSNATSVMAIFVRNFIEFSGLNFPTHQLPDAALKAPENVVPNSFAAHTVSIAI
jgi:hypothetical protein